jgi:phytol kinase
MVMEPAYEGILLAFALILGVLFFGWAIGRIPNIPKEFSRKFVHIGVSCFYFIYADFLYGQSIWIELALPVAFIAANLYIALSGKPKALASALKGSNRLGTVYYPISLVFLIVCLRLLDIGMTIDDFGAGVLVMGFGDGLAGLIGSMAGKNKIPHLPGTKTWLGSAVMFFVSFLVILLVYEGSLAFLSSKIWLYVLCALISTVIEAFTPKGLDNLTVPILTAFVCMLVL